MARVIVSGIQPSGVPHLGNYLGAVVNWVGIQRAAAPGTPLYYFLADLHCLTVPYDAANLSTRCREMTASLIACGLDTRSCSIFRQSSVREHSELCWILACRTPLGWLNRMTQYKQKSDSSGSLLGLYSYPVLMAADILLYKATGVPVGDDQKQHLELAQSIAGTFNQWAGFPCFPLPQPMIPATPAARIMALNDGTKKMSKSDPSDASRINLTDTADAIARKVRKAKTDSVTGFSFDPESRPEKSNLITIYSTLSSRTVESVCEEFASLYEHASAQAKPAGDFKASLTDLLVSTVCPIGSEVTRLLADPTHLDTVMAQGTEAATATAQDTMRSVRAACGLA